jgi:osmotically-inducible protein OsmY
MDRTIKKGSRLLLAGASLLLSASLLASPLPQDQQPAPDNTKMNHGDTNKDAVTADHQKMNPADREMTKKIRSAIFQDKSLSTYAHNVKIVTRNGQVTLKGPVRTEEEKSNVESKAAAVAGQSNVTSEITIAPSKS